MGIRRRRTSLPKDFAQIPDSSPKENVKAAVPGTRQAQEALVANQIPTTARVDRSSTKFTLQTDGEPKLVPITGTPLQYVLNASTPVIRVDDKSWYACQDGVWFVATSMNGPWQVADSVPAVIYSIPPSSPVYYVTYARVYRGDADVCVRGLHAGLHGRGCRAWRRGGVRDGLLLLTVGRTLLVRLSGDLRHGRGHGVDTVDRLGFWLRLSDGRTTARCGIDRRRRGGVRTTVMDTILRGGMTAWGPGGWATTSGNIYGHRGGFSTVQRGATGYNAFTGNQWATRYGTAYNSTTGTLITGQKGAVKNVYTGNYAYGTSGTATNTKTGASVTGGKVTVGNAYTGNSTTVGGISGSTPGGPTRSVVGAKGDNGGVVAVGGPGDKQVYGTKDGEVYKRSDSGQWEQVTPPRVATGRHPIRAAIVRICHPKVPTSGRVPISATGRAHHRSYLAAARRCLKATIRISIVSSRRGTWAISARAASSNRARREASKEAAAIEVAVAAGGGVDAPS